MKSTDRCLDVPLRSWGQLLSARRFSSLLFHMACVTLSGEEFTGRTAADIVIGISKQFEKAPLEPPPVHDTSPHELRILQVIPSLIHSEDLIRNDTFGWFLLSFYALAQAEQIGQECARVSSDWNYYLSGVLGMPADVTLRWLIESRSVKDVFQHLVSIAFSGKPFHPIFTDDHETDSWLQAEMRWVSEVLARDNSLDTSNKILELRDAFTTPIFSDGWYTSNLGWVIATCPSECFGIREILSSIRSYRVAVENMHPLQRDAILLSMLVSDVELDPIVNDEMVVTLLLPSRSG